jgi:hypothetical protein
MFDIERPIDCLRNALLRAIDNANATDEIFSKEFINKREKLQARIQRKGYLLIGALADSDCDLAQIINEKGGFEIILNAMYWYRLHEQVCKWGLWAIFIMTNDNKINKLLFVSLNSFPHVIQVMRNCPNNIDVARHGIAIHFDILRDQEEDDFGLDYDPKIIKMYVRKPLRSESRIVDNLEDV